MLNMLHFGVCKMHPASNVLADLVLDAHTRASQVESVDMGGAADVGGERAYGRSARYASSVHGVGAAARLALPQIGCFNPRCARHRATFHCLA